jgi:hypothetical protein
MTLNLADPPSSVRQRQARVVAASLRAAYAWSERKAHPGAMREIARMTGVVMEALGPGHGPAAPMQLVGFLRRPLGDLLTLTGDTDDPVAEAVLLSPDDRLADTAYDIACEYARQLTQTMTAGWLPSWTRMRAEQIQNEVFAALVESGDPGGYVLARRFLIDHPATDQEELRAQLLATGARLAARYSPLPPDQRYQARGRGWWWPCPVCKWPMTVTSDHVRCRYLPHQAVYQAVPGRASSPPRLLRTGDRSPRRAPAARRADNAACVDPGVWRYIVVPGASEVRIAASLEKLGADVQLWPDMDSYDLHVRAGRLDQRLDVKEYRSARRLIEDLRDKPPSVTILLPATHEHQLDVISTRLPSVAVVTETMLRRQVRQATARKQ